MDSLSVVIDKVCLSLFIIYHLFLWTTKMHSSATVPPNDAANSWITLNAHFSTLAQKKILPSAVGRVGWQASKRVEEMPLGTLFLFCFVFVFCF